MKIELGPTGGISKGNVLDVNKDMLLERIHDYDPLLYLVWNPKKRSGYGCWELRRRPEKKTATYWGEIDGAHLFTVDYKELDLENHVFDLAVIDYSLLTRIKKADMWVRSGYDRNNLSKIHQWTKDLHQDEDNYRSELEQKNYNDLLYNMQQHKSVMRAYKEAILSGTNPADIAKHW